MRLRMIAGFALAAVLAMGSAGCAGFNLGSDAGVASGTLNDERGLAYAEVTFQATAKAAEVAVDTGAIKAGSPQAVAVADALDEARNALVSVRQLQKAGNLPAADAAAAAVTAALKALQRSIE